MDKYKWVKKGISMGGNNAPHGYNRKSQSLGLLGLIKKCIGELMYTFRKAVKMINFRFGSFDIQIIMNVKNVVSRDNVQNGTECL